jgi:hypothetical protein
MDGGTRLDMRARSHSADRLLPSCGLLLGCAAGGGVLVSVALPLAFSSPFPTPRDGVEWIIDKPTFSVRMAAVSPDAEPQTDGRLVMAALEEPGGPLTFAERWNMRVPQAAMIPAPGEPDGGAAPESAMGEPEAGAASSPPASEPGQPPAEHHPSEPQPHAAPQARAAPRHTAAAPPADPVEQYLWEVYQRKPVKSDSTGDFTWKDQAAARRLGMSLRAYVIGGMDPDFREQLYHAGHAMDADGLQWSMLSAFRDDYRQGLASGFKAHGGNSLHGGSRATGGYGHGRAVDITSIEGEGKAEAIWHWVDHHGGKYGLVRPMTRIDPAHIQARGSYHDLAHDMREARHRLEARLNGATAAAPERTKVAAHVDK